MRIFFCCGVFLTFLYSAAITQHSGLILCPNAVMNVSIIKLIFFFHFRCLNGLELQVSPSPSSGLKWGKTEDGLGPTDPLVDSNRLDPW